jgi:hypothetical protein
MQRQFCIWIVTPDGYTHSRCFEEVALSLNEAFAALGLDAPIVTEAAAVQGTAIVLGPHLLPRVTHPEDLILYNLEQIYENPQAMTPAYTALLKQYPVWDYSARNLTTLAAHSIQAALCGVGYMPGLTRIPPAPARDIDVLFIGSMNPRRARVLSQIASTGAVVKVAFDCYGAERDARIARSKIVLNLHFYEAKLFEIVRVSYLLANRVCVVSETGLDAELEAPFMGGVAFAAYDGLAPACLRLLADAAARDRIAERGFEKMRALSQLDMLKRALAADPAS